MKIVTRGLSEEQQIEAVVATAHVDRNRAYAMLLGHGRDSIEIDGQRYTGPLLAHVDARSTGGRLTGVTAEPSFGEAELQEGSDATIYIRTSHSDSRLVPAL